MTDLHTPHRVSDGPVAAHPALDRSALLDRLTHGHTPDRDGWCTSPGHAPYRERHPCGVVRLATLITPTGGSPSGGTVTQRPELRRE